MSGFRADHKTARVRPSPNYGERKDGKSVNTIILHYTGMVSGEAAEDAAEQVAEVLVQAPDDDAVPPGAGGAQSETEPGEESP